MEAAFGPNGGGVAVSGFTQLMAEHLCDGVLQLKKDDKE